MVKYVFFFKWMKSCLYDYLKCLISYHISQCFLWMKSCFWFDSQGISPIENFALAGANSRQAISGFEEVQMGIFHRFHEIFQIFLSVI